MIQRIEVLGENGEWEPVPEGVVGMISIRGSNVELMIGKGMMETFRPWRAFRIVKEPVEIMGT